MLSKTQVFILSFTFTQCLSYTSNVNFLRIFCTADCNVLKKYQKISKRRPEIFLACQNGETEQIETLTIEKAEILLSSFDKEQQKIAKREGEGLGGGTSAARLMRNI